MADDTPDTSSGGALSGLGKTLVNVLRSVSYGAAGQLGQLHAQENERKKLILQAIHGNPDLIEVPEMAATVKKSFGLSKEGFEAFKLHLHSNDMLSSLAKITGTPTTEADPYDKGVGGFLAARGALNPESAAIAATHTVPRPTADVMADVSKAVPAGSSLSSGPKGVSLKVAQPKASSTDLVDKYQAAVTAGDTEKMDYYHDLIRNKTISPEERAKLTAEATRTAIEPFVKGAEDRRTQRQVESDARKQAAKEEAERKKPLYKDSVKWGKRQADGTVDASVHPSPSTSQAQAIEQGFIPIDPKERQGFFGSLFGAQSTTEAAPPPAEAPMKAESGAAGVNAPEDVKKQLESLGLPADEVQRQLQQLFPSK